MDKVKVLKGRVNVGGNEKEIEIYNYLGIDITLIDSNDNEIIIEPYKKGKSEHYTPLVNFEMGNTFDLTISTEKGNDVVPITNLESVSLNLPEEKENVYYIVGMFKGPNFATGFGGLNRNDLLLMSDVKWKTNQSGKLTLSSFHYFKGFVKI